MNSLFGGKGGRVPPPTRKLIIRKANSQRDLRPISERLSLDKVLGITTSSNSALACNPVTGVLAYPAGCIVVLFNPRRHKQDFIHNVSRKCITAVTFSKDGKFLATGESGHMPSVRVWNMEDPGHPQISEMKKGHKHGVSCVAFSPNLKFLVSVGYQHDMLINVWNWKDGSKVACNKFSTKVYAVSFSEIGNFFVTSGVRHVKFWYFDTESTKLKHDKTLPIKGRSGILGELRNHTFCDVACGLGDNSDYTYCVTTAGALCSFNAKRNLEKFVELGSSKALCMAVSEKYIICGYTNGFIRVFDPSSLQFIATLPKPHFLGVNVANGIDPSHMIAKTDNAIYADATALALDSRYHRLTCVYNDHSIYVWDLKDIKKVGKIWSSLYHSGCIWGLEIYPEVHHLRDNEAPLPLGTFLTCSNDDTVRVWNVTEGTNISSVKNIYSKELLRILYMDKTFASLKDTEISPTSKNVRDATSDGKSGVRTICTSPDGQHLAVGERSGNVRVYDCMFLDEIVKIDAHESEVLCIEFSPPESGYKLLASAGRDRLIHIFDVNKEFTLIQTLDDHSASITSVKFNVDENNDFQLLSCGADKSIIFRSAQYNPDIQFVRNTNYVGKTTLYDMAIDSSRNVAAIACQDRNVRVYDTSTGKQTKCYKGAQGDDGTLVKITMDNSGYYTATSCSDKTLSLHEFDTEECMATMSGHSEIVTGMRFTNDLTKLVTVSGDGCIFIWTIPITFTQNMTERLGEIGQELPREIQPETPLRRGTYRIEHNSVTEGFGSPSNDFLSGQIELDPPVADYRFSIGQLPSWAKKQIIAEGGASAVSPPEQDTGVSSQPGGRWAQRVNNGELQVVSETSPQSPITLSLDLGASDRKKFSKASDSFQEQVNALANSPLERKCSLTTGEDDDLFPANGKLQLDDLKEQDEFVKEGNIPQGVTLSRGSNPFSRPRTWTGEKLVYIETEEIQFEEAEESKEDDVKESIIYFPPAQDDMETETASHTCKSIFPGVKDLTRHYESLQATVGLQHWRQCQKLHKAINHLDYKPSYGKPNYKLDKSNILNERHEKITRSFQVTAALKPETCSVSDTEETGVKEGREEKKEKTLDESSSDEDDDPLSALNDVKADDAEDEVATTEKSENPDDDDAVRDDEDDEKCRKYFDCLGSTPTKEKPDEKPDTPVTSLTKTEHTTLPFLNGRLSISARFLSRSLLTTTRATGQQNAELLDEENDVERARTTSLEEHKLEIQRRKEEMARAVDANRKRLSALRKAKEERELRNVSQDPTTTAVSSSVPINVKVSSGHSSLEAEAKPTVFCRPLPLTDQTVCSRSTALTTSIEVLTSTMSTIKTTETASSLEHQVISSPSSYPIQLKSSAQLQQTDTSLRNTSTNLTEACLSTVSLTQNKKDQLIPEKDDNVWIKRCAESKRETNVAPTADLSILLDQTKVQKTKDSESKMLKDSEKEHEVEKDVIKDKTKDEKEQSLNQSEIEKRKESNQEKQEGQTTQTDKNEEGKQKEKLILITRKKENASEKQRQNEKMIEKENKVEKESEEKEKQENIDKKEKSKPASSVVAKLEKRGSSSSLMAQTKSSWRKSLGFSGFSSKHKDKKDRDRRGSMPFASTLRSSDQTTKRSEKILFRDKKGKVASEDRRSKSKSLGDLDARLKPLKEESILDAAVPPSHVVDTADIPRELSSTKNINESTTSPPPFADRRSPIGKDRDEKSSSKLQMYQDAVNQLNEAFKSISDLHSQVLEDDSSEDKDHILSLLTNTYSTMEEQCKRQRLYASQAALKSSNPLKPLNSNFSYSMSNIDCLRVSESVKMSRHASEACVPSAVDEQEAASRDLLMKYSDILVDMVKQKLNSQ